MNIICGLKLPGRSCIFFRLASLTKQGKYNKLYGPYTERCQIQVSSIRDRCRRLDSSGNNRNSFLTGSLTDYCRNFLGKGQRCLLNVPKTEVWKNAPHGSGRFCFQSSLLQGEKVTSFQISSAGLRPSHFSAQNIQIASFFHTSSSLQAAPVPLFWIIVKPAQKLFAIILGRSIRNWWKALPPNKRELFKESARRNKWKILLGISSLGVLFVMFYFTHLEETPITGRARLLVFGKEHFRQLSQMEYDMWMEEFKNKMLPETDARYQVVKSVVGHLSESNKDVPQVSALDWIIHVVDEPGVNAFVLPNGQVFVFTGLLNAVSDIHQLSFILGHEIAHAVLQHAAEKASLVHFLDFLSLIFLTMIWAICPRDSLAVVGQWIQSKLQEFMFDRPYSRTLEAEADKVGLQFAAKACVDVRASSVFWQQMELAEAIQGQPKLPEWLSTHPSHENRAEHLDRLIPEERAVVWQAALRPLLMVSLQQGSYRKTTKHFGLCLRGRVRPTCEVQQPYSYRAFPQHPAWVKQPLTFPLDLARLRISAQMVAQLCSDPHWGSASFSQCFSQTMLNSSSREGREGDICSPTTSVPGPEHTSSPGQGLSAGTRHPGLRFSSAPVLVEPCPSASLLQQSLCAARRGL